MTTEEQREEDYSNWIGHITEMINSLDNPEFVVRKIMGDEDVDALLKEERDFSKATMPESTLVVTSEDWKEILLDDIVGSRSLLTRKVRLLSAFVLRSTTLAVTK